MPDRFIPSADGQPAWPDSHWRVSADAMTDAGPLTGEQHADVAIIGAGYAGLNAGLELAEVHGVSAVVLEAAQPGWGASGRNGGFCCKGGALLDGAAIARRHGPEAAAEWAAYERDAIERVRDNLARYAIQADAGPEGEVQLAHSPRAYAALQADAAADPGALCLSPTELAERGLHGRFFGGVQTPAGFPLHPLKYLRGLVRAAQGAGVRLHGDSRVTGCARAGAGWRLTTARGSLLARRVLWATNGYSDEALLPWLSGRILPLASAILVTRPLSPAELQAQGWTSQIMAYDSRRVLHYFRLLPCGRFLFGGRGSPSMAPAAQAAFRQVLQAEFAALFPAWAGVDVEHYWSGHVCLTGSRAPWGGAVPGHDGMFAALGWHGNGVAAASEGGRRIAAALAGGPNRAPALLHRRPGRVVPRPLRPLALRVGMAAARWLDGPL
ncbi:MAG: FAD-binding oxidoreductase [Pararhodobacter sp.]|nr:FAD-binding oxidoreductase [Pararhodobacter sp.]